MNKKLVRVLAAATVATACNFWSYGVEAADEVTVTHQAKEDYSLGEYVITANRMQTKLVDTPSDVTVVSQADLEAGNFSTVSDALKSKNVNMVQKGFASYPVLNGDSRVLIMVDGRRLNWDHLMVSGDDNAVNVDQIPVENIERIEIVRGPSSSLYGERAMAGVINIITKRPAAEQKTTMDVRYGSWAERRVAVQTEGGNDDLTYRLGYTRELRGNYQYKSGVTGKNETFGDSQLNRNTISLALDKKMGNDRLSFDALRTQQNDGFGIYLTNPADSTSVYGKGNKTEVTGLNMGLTYTFDAEKSSSTFVRAYYKQDRADSPFGGTPYEHKLKGFGFEGQKEWKLRNHNLIAGAALQIEELWENNDGSTMDKRGTTKAFFVEDKWDLGKDWTASLGTRYEHHNDFGGNFASHVGVNKKLSDTSHIYLNWGQGVNNPTLKMRYANTPYMTGNADLQTEKSQTWTLGYSQEVNKKLTLNASVYQSKVSDALYWKWDSSIGKSYYYNVNNEKRRGLTLQANYKLNNAWTFNGGYTYTLIENDNNVTRTMTDNVYNNAPHSFDLGVTYNKNKWEVGVDAHYITGRSTDKFTSSKYFVTNAHVNYWLNDDVKIYANAYNLFNEAYETLALEFYPVGAFPMPGRHFSVGVNYTF